MHTCRKLRNLAKQGVKFGPVSINYMHAALVLLRKGIIMNELAVNSIASRENVFEVDRFEEFLDSQNCSQILKELQKDNKLYYTLLKHLQKNLKEELGDDQPRTQSIIALSNGRWGLCGRRAEPLFLSSL